MKIITKKVWKIGLICTQLVTKRCTLCVVIALQLLNRFSKNWCDLERACKDEENKLNPSLLAQTV
jgi:hypothetical protein